MSGARVFLGHRTSGELRLFDVWTREEASRFPWTFPARNLITIGDIGLRKLAKLLSRIPAGERATGLGAEPVEDWLDAPRAFGLKSGPDGDVVQLAGDPSTYPIGLVLDADDNCVDLFRPDAVGTDAHPPPGPEAPYLRDAGQRNVIRIRPRELKDFGLALQALLDESAGRPPGHVYWEEALLRRADRSVLSLADPTVSMFDSPTDEQLALEDAVVADDHRALRFMLEQGADPSLALSPRVGGVSPLDLAIAQGALGCVRALLDRGAPAAPSQVASAAEHGHLDVVQALLEARPSLATRATPRPPELDVTPYQTPADEVSDPGGA